MSIINTGQTATSSFRQQLDGQRKDPKIERRSSERRTQVDRRKEKRFGDVVDRRKKVERRSE